MSEEQKTSCARPSVLCVGSALRVKLKVVLAVGNSQVPQSKINHQASGLKTYVGSEEQERSMVVFCVCRS